MDGEAPVTLHWLWPRDGRTAGPGQRAGDPCSWAAARGHSLPGGLWLDDPAAIPGHRRAAAAWPSGRDGGRAPGLTAPHRRPASRTGSRYLEAADAQRLRPGTDAAGQVGVLEWKPRRAPREQRCGPDAARPIPEALVSLPPVDLGTTVRHCPWRCWAARSRLCAPGNLCRDPQPARPMQPGWMRRQDLLTQ